VPVVGTYGAGDLGIADVTVGLYSDSGFTTIVGVTTTNASGQYSFTSLANGTFYVKQRCPKLCSKNQDGAAACRACAAYDGSANWVRIGGCEPLFHALCEL
jgi:hypothetical protein